MEVHHRTKCDHLKLWRDNRRYLQSSFCWYYSCHEASILGPTYVTSPGFLPVRRLEKYLFNSAGQFGIIFNHVKWCMLIGPFVKFLSYFHLLMYWFFLHLFPGSFIFSPRSYSFLSSQVFHVLSPHFVPKINPMVPYLY